MARAKNIMMIAGTLIVLVMMHFYGVGVAGAVDAGIGLYTSTNAETIMEGTTLCMTYKIYNPSGVDVTGVLIGRRICPMKDNIRTDWLKCDGQEY